MTIRVRGNGTRPSAKLNSTIPSPHDVLNLAAFIESATARLFSRVHVPSDFSDRLDSVISVGSRVRHSHMQTQCMQIII